MFRMSLDSLTEGMVLGKGIYADDGRLLLGRGVAINPYYTQRLRELGISSIYIQDDCTDDVIPVENISETLRGSTLRHMKELLGSIEELGKEIREVSVSAIRDAVTSVQFQNTFRNQPMLEKIQKDAFDIVKQILDGEVIIGISSLKTYDNYTFQHSIDVAVLSIMIGRKLGLSQKRLREIGIGCILHDIGKTFIPREILNKPTRLTPKEFEIMKSHPTIGFEMVRGADTVGILPPHIVLQHHEKQNGTGYPRGITGNNRLEISDEPRSIHLYGSIAAVADIYDALSSDRPYRKALPPEKVIDAIAGMSGHELNREILRIFLQITPVHPVGSTVRVTRGKYLHYTGVVVQHNEERLDRPFIRLIFNGVRKRVYPIDINLLRDRDTEVVSEIL
jgi:putative nucleotidyltransferase with HDIG domain